MARIDTCNQGTESLNPFSQVNGRPISRDTGPPAAGFTGGTPGVMPTTAGSSNTGQSGFFPGENMIPEFGQPLPQVPTREGTAAGGAPGQGFTTYRSPDSTAAATPLTQPSAAYSQPESPQPCSNSAIERRVMKLEQIAFGATYGEHELSDRIDHLETEVFGSTSTGDPAQRLSKLEARLVGGGAFGQTAQMPLSLPAAGSYGAGKPESPSPYEMQFDNPGASGYRHQAQQVAIAGPQENFQPEASTTSGAGATSAAGGATGIFDPQRIIQAIPFDQRAGDYFSEIQRGPGRTVARWTNFPVRVNLPSGSPQSWQLSLQAGLKHWGHYLPLTIAAPGEPFDIDVIWENHLPPDDLGITRIRVLNGTMQCVIYLLRPTFYLPDVPESALAGVFLHEMGHALGIAGHSNFKEDLMVPIELNIAGRTRSPSSRYKFGSISPRDVNTLKHIYETPPAPPGFTTAQPTDWTGKYVNTLSGSKTCRRRK